MTEQFIPYQQALALKELGFDEPCFAAFSEDNGIPNLFIYWSDLVNEDEKFISQQNCEIYDYECLAPIFSQAFDFFEKKFGLYVEWLIDGWKDDDKVDGEFICYRVFIWKVEKPRPGVNEDIGAGSKEQMNLRALKELIEIVK